MTPEEQAQFRQRAVDRIAGRLDLNAEQKVKLDVLVAKDAPTRDRLWEARRLILEALKHESPVSHMEDVVVPRARIPQALAGIKEIAARHGLRIICFGHAGDGNIHVNIMVDSAVPQWQSRSRKVLDELFRQVIGLDLQIKPVGKNFRIFQGRKASRL